VDQRQQQLIVFDLDGVITSEAGYWSTARAGLREILGSEAVIPQEFIYWVKNHAVNHNWDLAFVARSAQPDFAAFRQRHDRLTGKDLLAACEGYRGAPWLECHEVCQRIQDSLPPPVEVLLDARPMFESLQERWIFGVATGRPLPEALPPLRASGVLEYFDPARIVTHDDVVAMEAAHPGQSFGKPNPFILHRAMKNIPAESTVFVGDTLSDILAAGRAQVRSIGVLHSLPAGEYREARRKSLAEAGCKTILETVLDLPEVLLEKQ